MTACKTIINNLFIDLTALNCNYILYQRKYKMQPCFQLTGKNIYPKTHRNICITHFFSCIIKKLLTECIKEQFHTMFVRNHKSIEWTCGFFGLYNHVYCLNELTIFWVIYACLLFEWTHNFFGLWMHVYGLNELTINNMHCQLQYTWNLHCTYTTISCVAPATLNYCAPGTVSCSAPATLNYSGPGTVSCFAPATLNYSAPGTVSCFAPATLNYSAPLTVSCSAPAIFSSTAPATISWCMMPRQDVINHHLMSVDGCDRGANQWQPLVAPGRLLWRMSAPCGAWPRHVASGLVLWRLAASCVLYPEWPHRHGGCMLRLHVRFPLSLHLFILCTSLSGGTAACSWGSGVRPVNWVNRLWRHYM